MELKTIQEVLAYWQEWIAKEPSGMPDNDPEDIHGHIAHVAVSDHYEEWEEKYPIVGEVVDLAYDIDLPEWYSFDHKASWNKIKALVAELEKQLNQKGS